MSAVLAPTPVQTPALGQPWPGVAHSFYAGVMRAEAAGQPDYHLVAIVDPSARKHAWGEWGRNVAGANHRRDGLANTQAMVEAGCPVAVHAIAAGYYLASQAEAQLCAANLHEHFAKGWHWTSTQYSPSYAWVQDFEHGISRVYIKGSEFRAVAVRRFVLQPFDPSGAPA